MPFRRFLAIHNVKENDTKCWGSSYDVLHREHLYVKPTVPRRTFQNNPSYSVVEQHMFVQLDHATPSFGVGPSQNVITKWPPSNYSHGNQRVPPEHPLRPPPLLLELPCWGGKKPWPLNRNLPNDECFWWPKSRFGKDDCASCMPRCL